MRSKPRRLLQALLLVNGLLCAGYAGYSYAAMYVYQEYEGRQFDLAVAGRNEIIAPPSLQPPQPGTLIGKISSLRLGISAMVREGVDARTLRVAVGHIPSTALPGQPGNVGVSAHRDTLFRNLKDARINDEFTLTTPAAEYVYQVVSLTVVEPSEVSVLSPSVNHKTLTLVTCYPFYYVGHAPKRFIVRALQLTPAVKHPTIASPLAATAVARMPIAIQFNAGTDMER